HSKGLVDDQHVGIHMNDDRECQAHKHAAGIMLHRLIDEVTDSGKLNNGRQTVFYLFLTEPVDRSIENGIFTTGKIWVETRPQLQQGSYPAPSPYSTRRGTQRARNDLQERGFTRTIPANDAKGFALTQLEVDVFQSAKSLAASRIARHKIAQQPLAGPVVQLIVL